VWEIVLGAYDLFAKEESMVDVRLEDGMTCDVIGDVHGEWDFGWSVSLFTDEIVLIRRRPILRLSSLVISDRTSLRATLLAHERRPRRSGLVVNRSHLDGLCAKMYA
jgi:hypothetical protein